MATRKPYEATPPKMAYLFGDSFFDTDIKEREEAEKERAFASYLRYLADGNTKAYSYRRVGLTRNQIDRKREQNTEFAAMEERAVAEGVECLEQEAMRRAVHGEDEPVFYKGEICGHVVKRSDSLLQFLLKAKDPKYRETRSVVSADVRSTVSQGVPSFDTSNLTEEELLQLEDLLSKGAVSD